MKWNELEIVCKRMFNFLYAKLFLFRSHIHVYTRVSESVGRTILYNTYEGTKVAVLHYLAQIIR